MSEDTKFEEQGLMKRVRDIHWSGLKSEYIEREGCNYGSVLDIKPSARVGKYIMSSTQ